MPDRPYLYFYIAMAVAAFTLVIMLLAFLRGGIDEIIAGDIDKSALTDSSSAIAGYDAIDTLRQQQTAAKAKEGDDHSWAKIRRMVTDPLVLSLMLWSFFYVSPTAVHAQIGKTDSTRPVPNPLRVDTWYVIPFDSDVWS